MSNSQSFEKELDVTLAKIRAEVLRAKKLFPANRFVLAALTEEVGELNQAMIDHARNKPGVTNASIEEEAVQTAAMAIRVFLDGDDSFPYRYRSAE